ncbi:MAG TPA: hypothetical protein VLR70_06485 [Arthrobacter sp.]|nr:hypothetical protein [Arthrobacter sp.]
MIDTTITVLMMVVAVLIKRSLNRNVPAGRLARAGAACRVGAHGAGRFVEFFFIIPFPHAIRLGRLPGGSAAQGKTQANKGVFNLRTISTPIARSNG